MVHSTAPGFWWIHPESPPCPWASSHPGAHTRTQRQTPTHTCTDRQTDAHTHTSPRARRLWLTHFPLVFFPPFCTCSTPLRRRTRRRGRFAGWHHGVPLRASHFTKFHISGGQFSRGGKIKVKRETRASGGACMEGEVNPRDREGGDWHCWTRATSTGDKMKFRDRGDTTGCTTTDTAETSGEPKVHSAEPNCKHAFSSAVKLYKTEGRRASHTFFKRLHFLMSYTDMSVL